MKKPEGGDPLFNFLTRFLKVVRSEVDDTDGGDDQSQNRNERKLVDDLVLQREFLLHEASECLPVYNRNPWILLYWTRHPS